MFLNYPNNPTGGVVEDDFFERAVAFARRHELIVVHDNAYSEITYDGYRAPCSWRPRARWTSGSSSSRSPRPTT